MAGESDWKRGLRKGRKLDSPFQYVPPRPSGSGQGPASVPKATSFTGNQQAGAGITSVPEVAP